MKQALSVSAMALGATAMAASAASFDYSNTGGSSNRDLVTATTGSVSNGVGTFFNGAQSTTQDTGLQTDRDAEAQGTAEYVMGPNAINIDMAARAAVTPADGRSSFNTAQVLHDFDFYWTQIGDQDYNLEGDISAFLQGAGQFRYEVNFMRSYPGPFGVSFAPDIVGNNSGNSYLFGNDQSFPAVDGTFSETVSLLDGVTYRLQVTVQTFAGDPGNGISSLADFSFTGSTWLTPVPAPATAALLGMGGLVAGRRRRD